MSFFSVVEFDGHAGLDRYDGPVSRELRTLVRRGEAYRDHQLLWRLFREPGQDAAELADVLPVRNFLFRRRTELSATLAYYVVSADPPRPVAGLLTVRTKPYKPSLRAGDRVAFDLRANPVVCRKRSDGHGAHHDVLMDRKVLLKSGTQALADPPEIASEDESDPARAWFTARAGRWGLEPSPESVITAGHTRHRLKPDGRAEIVFSSLDYTGTATVRDPEALRAAMLGGVGKKRGFGCGLLLIRRVD